MRRETKTWAGRLTAAAVVVFVLAYVPYHVYVRSGSRARSSRRRDLIALHAHNQELAAENQRLAREAEALRDDPAAIERVARDELGWSARVRSSSTCRATPGPALRTAGHEDGEVEDEEPHARRARRLPRRLTRASLAFVVCGVVLVLLWLGWFPTCGCPARTCGASPPPRC